MALFVKLDVTWVDSRKIVLAPMAVRGCHATAMCIAKRTENDGWFPRVLLVREGADEALIDDLIARGLLEAEDDVVRPFDWLDRNPSQAAIGAKRASKSEAGKRGNHTKWLHPEPFESCPICHVIAGSDRTGSHSDRISSPESDADTESPGDRTSSHPGFAGPKPTAALELVKGALGKPLDDDPAHVGEQDAG